MKCKKVHKLMDSYLSGDLPASLKAKLELHLPACSSCYALLKAGQALESFIVKDRETSINPLFYKNMMIRLPALQQVNVTVSGQLTILKRFAIAASVTIAVLSGVVAGFTISKRVSIIENGYSYLLNEDELLYSDNQNGIYDYLYSEKY